VQSSGEKREYMPKLMSLKGIVRKGILEPRIEE
jgi:hypothetical protein